MSETNNAPGSQGQIRNTASARLVLQSITDYLEFFTACKRPKPEQVYLTRLQFTTLGVKPGYRFQGVTLVMVQQ